MLKKRKNDKFQYVEQFERQERDSSHEPSLLLYSIQYVFYCIMTDCEKRYFEVIKEIVEPEYRIQPQINLASIIDKDTQSRYRNELFRNVDFGVFDKNYSLMVLIEINDQTHTQKDRIARDSKVKAICEEAGIPLVTFWTKYGINEQYIRGRLTQHLPLIADATDTASAEVPAESIN